jgi:hypothetical protein
MIPIAYLPPIVARLSMTTSGFDEAVDRARAKLDELKKTIHDTVKIKYDDSELKKLTKDLERAGLGPRWGDRPFKTRIDVDGAMEALGKIEAVQAAADHLNGKNVRIRISANTSQLGIISRLIEGVGSKIPGSIGPVPLAGIAAALPAAAALLVEVTGIASGLAAAGAGAAAFGLLAAPAFKSVRQESQALSQAQDKLAHAKDVFAVAPTEKHAKALKEAADQLRAYERHLSHMPKTQQEAIKGMSGLSDTLGKMSRAFEPKAFSVFTSGLKLLKDLLPSITPFANTFATAMSKWLTNLDKASKGKGFQDFLKGFHSLEGPALQAITAGIDKVAGSIGRLLTVMSGKDVGRAIGLAFSVISGIIDRITYGIHNIMQMWDTLSAGAARVGRGLAATFKGWVQDFRNWAHNIAGAFDNVRHWIASKFDGVRHAIAAKFNGAVSWLADKAHDIATAFDHVRHWIASKFDGVKSWIASKFDGAASWLVSVGKDVIQGLINGLNAAIPGLSGVVSHIAGIVKSVAGMLGIHSPSTVMFGYGANIAQGLALGMLAGASHVQAAAGALAVAASGGWVGQAGAGLIGSTGGGAGFGGGHAALAGGGGETVHQVNVFLNGRQIHTEMAKESITTQRRTGHNGMTKRTR